jgi:adenosylmethionine-8-amino-7-oxononanoate aminotransferase
VAEQVAALETGELGLSSEALERLRAQDVAHLVHPFTSVQEHARLGPKLFVAAEGVRVRDAAGRWYIDAYAGQGNCLVGYGRREIADAVQEQMRQMAFVSTFLCGSNTPAIELATKLASLAPPGLDRVFLSSGGSEANETAFKLARLYFHLRGLPQKIKILYRHYGYHGVTFATLSANGSPVYRQGVGPLLEGFRQVASTYCFKCDLGKTYPSCQIACADDIEQRILAEGPETVAAVILEPASGAGGHIFAPPGYLQRVRAICDRYDVLLIADEVVTAFGRTGEWFGVNHEGVVPDIMTLAKGISSGYLPLGATLFQERIYQQMLSTPHELVFAHAYTYSGHATCCAAGLKNLEIIERDGLVDKAREDGAYLLEQLRSLADLEIVGEVRGVGMMAAVDLVKDRATREKWDAGSDFSKRLFERLFELGVIVRVNNDTVGLRPPLTITRAEMDEVVDAVRRALMAAQAEV